VSPTENAIAAVGKICLYQSGAVDVSKVLPVWLSWLPVLEDKVESLVTYGQLCTFVERYRDEQTDMFLVLLLR
jgi:hypothetical protein